MTLTVTPQVVRCNGTGRERGAPINGKVPHWHISYYDCSDCDDNTPSDQMVFRLTDGTSTGDILVTGEELLWRRIQWAAPRGIVLTELVRSMPCSRGRHLYWRWRFMTDEELAALGPTEEV